MLVVSASLGLGASIAFIMLPNRGILKDILLTAPPKSAETLTAFQPADDEASAINEQLLNMPLVKQIRGRNPISESRPSLKIPESLRPTMLTTGPLSGPGAITVPPLQFELPEGTVTVFHLGPKLCGHPGIVHGGVIATLLDEGLARCCFPKLPSRFGVTATLNITYSGPAEANNFFVLYASTDSVEGRKAKVSGKLLRIHGVEDNSDGEVDLSPVADSQALFVTPRAAKVSYLALPSTAFCDSQHNPPLQNLLSFLHKLGC